MTSPISGPETPAAVTTPSLSDAGAPPEAIAAPGPEAAEAPAAAVAAPSTDAPVTPIAAERPSVIDNAAPTPAQPTTAGKASRYAKDFARRYGAQAAALTVALGVGYGIARATPGSTGETAYLRETTAGVRESRQALAKLGEEVALIKTSLERVKQGVEKPRGEAKSAQVMDRLDQGTRDLGERVGRVAEQVERIERTQRDPARLAGVTDRLERLEKQLATIAKPAAAPHVASTPVAPVAAASPGPAAAKPAPDTVAATGSIAKPARVEGWIVRDAGPDGALIESPSGRLREVYPGQTLPGGIRVEAMKRQGRAWVVVTSKGLITPN